MINKESIQKIKSEIEEGMKLTKCKKCGCMKGALESLLASLPLIEKEITSGLFQKVKARLKEMEPIEYACLGCKHCFSAEATNISFLL